MAHKSNVSTGAVPVDGTTSMGDGGPCDTGGATIGTNATNTTAQQTGGDNLVVKFSLVV